MKHSCRERLTLFLLAIVPVSFLVYWICQDNKQPSATLSTSDWTVVLGAVLTYVGAAIVGWMMYKVNKRLVIIEERNQEISELKLIQESAPRLDIDLLSVIQKPLLNNTFAPVESNRETSNGIITRYSVQQLKKDATDLDIKVAIKNHSNNVAYCFQWKTMDKPVPDNCGEVALGRDVVLSFQVPLEIELEASTDIKPICYNTIDISYDNVYGHHYNQKATLGVQLIADALYVSFSLAMPDGAIRF